MENSPAEDISRSNKLIGKCASLKSTYGDESPIIFYNPNIEKAFQDIVQENKCMHHFTEFQEAVKFAKSLGISFLFIAPGDYEDQKLVNNFQDLEDTFNRRMFDFEEEALIKDLFKGQILKSFKVFVFFTRLDFFNPTTQNKEEEEVTVMCDVKEIIQNFHQEFIIIWYNPSACPQSKEKLEELAEIEIRESDIYTNFGELWKRIENYSGPPYHLIFSEKSEAEKIVRGLKDFKELLGFYICCDDMQIRNSKVDVRKTLEELIPKIKEGIRNRSPLKLNFPAFATDFDAWDKSHLYNVHYYLKNLTNFQNRKQAKDDFINLARKIYQDKKKTLNEFEGDYSDYNKKKILRWYTKPSPIYRMINNCLRMSSLDSILYCRFLLKDLERAIREHYKEESNNFNGMVFRGAYISSEEWEKLKKNVGKEIEMYGFLSTSVSSKTALDFARDDTKNKIFITIIIPPLPELDEQGFADISQISELPKEKEILFNVRSRFKILELGVFKIDNQQNTCRHLVLLYGAQTLRKFMTNSQPSLAMELALPSSDLKCQLCGSREKLFGLKKHGSEVRCVNCLIREGVPKDIPLLALGSQNVDKISLKGKLLSFNPDVSVIFYGYKCNDCGVSGEEEKYYKWIEAKSQKMLQQCSKCFEKKTEIKPYHILISEGGPYAMWQEYQSESEKINSEFHEAEFLKDRDQDDVYQEARRFDLSLEYQKRKVNKLSRKRAREMDKLSHFDCIGQALQKLGKHQQALQYHNKILDLRKKLYRGENLAIARSYHGLALVYADLEEHKEVLKYHEKVLKITGDFYGGAHPQVRVLQNNVATGYDNLGEYQTAYIYYLSALNMIKQISGENHPSTSDSYYNVAKICEKLANYSQALEYHFKALNVRKAIYGENHPSTANSYNGLASVYKSLGEFQKALDYSLKGLSIRIEIYGEKDKNTVLSYRNLGLLYGILGERQKALEYREKALEITKEVYGENHPHVASLYSAFAGDYKNLGEYQKAFELSKKALEMRKSAYGEKHPETIESYGCIALVYQNLGEHQEALDCSKKTVNLSQQIFGEDHPRTALSYNDIAQVYLSLGDHKTALEYNNKALTIRKAKYGEKHHHVATSYHGLASVYQERGSYEEALEYQYKALSIRESLYGEEHPHTVALYNDIAIVYRQLGDYKKAMDYHNKVLDIITKETYEGKDQYTAISYTNLASVYEALGEYQKASEFQHKALEIMKIIYPEKHPDTAGCYNQLGIIYQNFEKYQEALEYHKKALDLRQKLYPTKHPSTASSYSNIALVFKKLGQHQKALEFQTKALDIYESVNEKSHPDTAVAYLNLGAIYCSLADFQKALDYYKKSLDIMKTILNEKHPTIAGLYFNIAEAQQELGNLKLALDYHNKALEIRKSIFKENHPDVVASYHHLASVYQSQGEPGKALEYYNKALGIRKTILGANHSNTADSLSGLASRNQSSTDHPDVLMLHNEVLGILKSRYGEKHPKVASSYDDLALVYQSSQNNNQALECREKALDIRRSIFGEYHADTASSYFNAAVVYSNLKMFDKALEYYKKALEIREIVHKEKNHVALMTVLYHNLGLTYGSLGDLKESLKYHQKALEGRKALFGENHLRTAYSYTGMAAAYEGLKDWQKAFEAYEKSFLISINVCELNHPYVASLWRAMIAVCQHLEDSERGQITFISLNNFISLVERIQPFSQN